MSDHDAFWHEMAGSTSPQRLGHEPDVHVLDSILDGQQLPPSADHGIQVLTSKLAELAAPGGAGTLAGETAAMSEFRRRFSPASTLPVPLAGEPEPQAAPRRPRRWLGASRARLAGAVAVLAVILGGGSVAAYARALPAPVQEFAHYLIGAPAAKHSPARHAPGTHAGQSQQPHKRGSAQRLSGVHNGRGHSAPRGKAAGHTKIPHHGKRAGKNKPRPARSHASPGPKNTPKPKNSLEPAN